MNASMRKAGRPRDETLVTRRRAEILDVATPLFARHGFRQMDVQWVADELGIGKGTIYRYFPTKEQLFLDAVDRGMQRLSEQMCAATESEADPLERIRLAMETYLRFFETHPALVELLMQERAEFKDRKKPTYFEYRDTTTEDKRQFFRQLIDEGRVRPIDVDAIVQVIDNMLYGAIFTNYFADRKPPPEAQAAHMLDIALCGILTDEERDHRCGRS